MPRQLLDAAENLAGAVQDTRMDGHARRRGEGTAISGNTDLFHRPMVAAAGTIAQVAVRPNSK